MQTRYTRRTLMKTAAVGAGALALGPTAKVLGANDKVRVAFIGLGGRGKGLLGSFSRLENVTVAGLCDADEKNLGGQANKFPDAFATTDLRTMLDRKDIDAIVSFPRLSSSSIAQPLLHPCPCALLPDTGKVP